MNQPSGSYEPGTGPLPGAGPTASPYGSGAPPGYPPPGGYAPATAPPKRRPGRLWYLVPLVAVVAGIAWIIFGIFSFIGQIDSFQRVPLPQGGTVSLSRGSYVIYYEGPGAAAGNVPRFNVRIVPASSGAVVGPLRPYGSSSTSLTYTYGSHQGTAVLTLQVNGSGQFRLESGGGAFAPGASHLVVGHSIASGIISILVPGVPLIVLGFILWLAILIIRIVRKRQQQPAPTWQPSTGGGYPPTAP